MARMPNLYFWRLVKQFSNISHLQILIAFNAKFPYSNAHICAVILRHLHISNICIYLRIFRMFVFIYFNVCLISIIIIKSMFYWQNPYYYRNEDHCNLFCLWIQNGLKENHFTSLLPFSFDFVTNCDFFISVLMK